MLYMLPNKKFIDPATVVAIRFLEGREDDGEVPHLPSRVSIRTLPDGYEMVYFGTDEEAKAFHMKFGAVCMGCQTKEKK